MFYMFAYSASYTRPIKCSAFWCKIINLAFCMSGLHFWYSPGWLCGWITFWMWNSTTALSIVSSCCYCVKLLKIARYYDDRRFEIYLSIHIEIVYTILCTPVKTAMMAIIIAMMFLWSLYFLIHHPCPNLWLFS